MDNMDSYNGTTNTNTDNGTVNYDDRYRPAGTAQDSTSGVPQYETAAAPQAGNAGAPQYTAAAPQAGTAGTPQYGAAGIPQAGAAEAARGISWQGSTYSGTPAADDPYRTYRVQQPQNDAYAHYASGYGYVPGNGAPAAGTYGTASVIPDVPRKEKKKRKMPAFVRVLLSAALFGIVAAGVFMLTNELYYRLSSKSAPAASTAASSGSITGRTAMTSKDPDANAVASTALITDISSTATDVSPVVETAMPSIVSIDCTFLKPSYFGTYETAGAGSGIILKKTDTELLVATNNHVVDQATSINVTFCDGTTAPAIIKGTDSTADLAVISVDLNQLSSETLSAIKVATLGNSDDAKVGQMVVAIGNSMGYGQSTTVGYVSAKDREVTVEGTVMTLLQTDAAINPGNSGGALLNLDGEVIGINSVKYSDESVEGMGFAIPISRAVAILDELAARETLSESEKGYLGVYPKDVSAEMAAAYNIPVGAYVSAFVDGSPAEAGGIQIGDIITAVNGISVSNAEALRNSITSYRAGTTVTITHYRLIDGVYTELTSQITLISNPTAE